MLCHSNNFMKPICMPSALKLEYIKWHMILSVIAVSTNSQFMSSPLYQFAADFLTLYISLRSIIILRAREALHMQAITQCSLKDSRNKYAHKNHLSHDKCS